MLEQIVNLVKEFGQQTVVENPEVPNQHNQAVMSEAANSVAGTLQNALANGNVQDLMGLFQHDDDAAIQSHPLAQQMQTGFIDNITQKLGISKQTAIGIGAALLPMLISTLVKRTRSQAPQDSGFDISSLIGSLTGGGQTGGISQLISQFTGGGQQQNTGGLDIASIIGQLGGGARQQQQTNPLEGLIGNLFGR